MVQTNIDHNRIAVGICAHNLGVEAEVKGRGTGNTRDAAAIVEVKEGANVTGTATAASMWNTGAIGVSVAFNRYEIAIVLSLINFLILQFASPIKRRVRGQ